MSGLVHIYYGNGKGKTTAALGLALRASGSGKKAVIVQFLKDWSSGELESLALIPNITVLRGKASGGVFIHEMTDEQRAATTLIHNNNLKQALKLQSEGTCDILVLDEVIDAINLNVLDPALINELLDSKPDGLELIITGHNPSASLLQRADYITEMVKHKHPYDEGVTARKGIEF